MSINKILSVLMLVDFKYACRVWCALIVSLFLPVAICSAKSVTLGVQTRGGGGIAVGDKFQITVSITEGIEGEPPMQPSFKGAKMLYPEPVGPIMVTRRQTINGHTTSFKGVEWTYTLKAETKGKYTFGPITVGGVKSNTLQYTIGDVASDPYGGYMGTPQPQSEDDDVSNGPKFIGKGTENLFLVARVSKSTAYEQEALEYTVTLYTTYPGIRFLGATESPKFDGFTLEEAKDRINGLHTEVYKGKAYSAAVIARYVIFPQLSGNLKIVGNKYTITVESRTNYYDPFFGHMSVGHPKQLSVQPNDLSVNVRSLPEPRPAGFSGGVGHFSLRSQLPSKKLTTNQAASVIYIIEGSGNIKYITMPDLNAIYPSELEVYTPDATVNASVSGPTVRGSARFDYSVMPLESGNYCIPSVNLVYFDPDRGAYLTTTAHGGQITVEKGKTSAKSQKRENVTFDPQLMPVDNKLAKTHEMFTGSYEYWLCYILPLILFCGVLYFRRRHIKAYSDIAMWRSRKAGTFATRRLQTARKALDAGNRTEFYDEILAALWGFAADRMRMSGSELNRDNILGNLHKAGINDADAEAFIKLIDECEYAKYAPGAASSSMKEDYERAKDIINLLNKRVKQDSNG